MIRTGDVEKNIDSGETVITWDSDDSDYSDGGAGEKHKNRVDGGVF